MLQLQLSLHLPTPEFVFTELLKPGMAPACACVQYRRVRIGPSSQPAGSCSVPTPSSNTLAVPLSFPSSADLLHLLAVALAKPLIKVARKERTERRAQSTPPETLSGSLHSDSHSLQVTPKSSHLFPKVMVPTASMVTDIPCQGHSPKCGKGTIAGPHHLFSGNHSGAHGHQRPQVLLFTI